MKTIKSLTFQLILFSVLLAFGACSTAGTKEATGGITAPKNIIILVSDGMGYNHLLASNYFEHGKADAQPFQQEDWISLAMATFPSVLSTRDGDTIYADGYSPQRAATDPLYVKSYYTDSGAGATSLSTGVKSYNGSIGIGVKGDTLIHMSQAAKALGKATGIVSSVPLSHATPAGFVAHNRHRNNYAEIAQYLFFHTQTDVIMATGNPDYDNDGNPAENNPRYVGGREVWDLLKKNDGSTVFETEAGIFRVQDANGNEQPDPWTLIQSREEFVNMASGPAPSRVLGVPKVYSTLQQGRTEIEDHTMPWETPLVEGVPTLEEMTRASLNVLAQNPNGFFVMIEGGAVDWASHNNNSARTIEEQIDFNNSVKAVIEWVETYSNWDETLVIVTSDHECGYLTGPGDADPVYGPVTNNGKGNLPGMQWHYGSHTNSLVPFFAKGPGAESFTMMADTYDPVYGPFIQNTDIAKLVFMVWGKPEVGVHKLN